MLAAACNQTIGQPAPNPSPVKHPRTDDRLPAVAKTASTTVSAGQPRIDPPRLTTPHDELTLGVPGFLR